MFTSVLLSIPFLCYAASAVDVAPPIIPTPLGPVTACGAQAVLDTCISSTTAIAMSCPTTDYNCLCQKYTDVLTCYNNCPNDPRISGAQATKASYCANASAYQSTTSSLSSYTMSSAMSSATTITGSHPSYTSSMSSASGTAASSTSSAATPTSTNKSDGSKARVSVSVMLCAIMAMFV